MIPQSREQRSPSHPHNLQERRTEKTAISSSRNPNPPSTNVLRSRMPSDNTQSFLTHYTPQNTPPRQQYHQNTSGGQIKRNTLGILELYEQITPLEPSSRLLDSSIQTTTIRKENTGVSGRYYKDSYNDGLDPSLQKNQRERKLSNPQPNMDHHNQTVFLQQHQQYDDSGAPTRSRYNI